MKKIFIILLSIIAISALKADQNKTWQVYFTTPGSGIRGIVKPDEGLINALKGAQESVYGAFYDISSITIADEFIAAHKRGVKVALVTEKDNYSGQALTSMIEAGIPVVKDNSPGLMHNKFAVIDKKFIFTGSFNLTDNCRVKNNNNAILIKSAELSKIYLDEFREMFDNKIFGNRKEYGAFSFFRKKNSIQTGNLLLKVFFSPEDDVEKIICNNIADAEHSIRFMAFSFTSPAISELMIEKFHKGIKVSGIFEKKGAYTKHSEFIKMKLEGLPVQVDRNRFQMHHKVIIIDDYRVITGSYNFSKNAALRNDENILIIDNREIAKQYIDEYNRLYLKR
jgi:phosphatidylserine/phosphatidylglycerophosphate/cardiolipin synthase-like enzyme